MKTAIARAPAARARSRPQQIRHEARVRGAGPPRDSGQHVFGVGELRNRRRPLRTTWSRSSVSRPPKVNRCSEFYRSYERTAASFCNPSRGPISANLDALASAFRSCFDFDERRAAAHDGAGCHAHVPVPMPSWVASIRCSIFIASRTTSRSRSTTRSPTRTATDTIFPGIGDVIVPRSVRRAVATASEFRRIRDVESVRIAFEAYRDAVVTERGRARVPPPFGARDDALAIDLERHPHSERSLQFPCAGRRTRARGDDGEVTAGFAQTQRNADAADAPRAPVREQRSDGEQGRYPGRCEGRVRESADALRDTRSSSRRA